MAIDSSQSELKSSFLLRIEERYTGLYAQGKKCDFGLMGFQSVLPALIFCNQKSISTSSLS